MRKPYYLLVAGILSLFCLTCCNHTDTTKTAFNPDALPPFSVEIDVSRDTVLRAPEGSLVHIPANALDAGGATRVKLVIREALRMSDMIRAGLLTTTSDGKTLSSGGIIDIEPAEGQTVAVKKPLSISLPTSYLEKDMQLFKGERDANGNLVWKDPAPLSSSVDSALAQLNMGKTIFTTNCASCHALGKTVLGSDLAYISQRRDRRWLYEFIWNNKVVLAAGDRLANCIYLQYNKTQMNNFPNLTTSDLDGLFNYIDNESARLGLPFPEDHNKHCLDSCGYKPDLARIAEVKASLRPGMFGQDTTSINDRRIFYSPNQYEFTIWNLGWYNTDRYWVENPETIELRAKIPLEYLHDVNVYLVIPSYRVLQGSEKDGEGICLFHGSAQVPFPKGVKMSIVALGEKNGQTLMGSAAFLSAEKQIITVAINAMSKDKVKALLRQFDLPDPPKTDKASAVQTPMAGNVPNKTPPGARDCDCGCPMK